MVLTALQRFALVVNHTMSSALELSQCRCALVSPPLLQPQQGLCAWEQQALLHMQEIALAGLLSGLCSTLQY